jgi:hypothetical protein
MTAHNIDKYHQCTEKQIYTDLSPNTDGVFAYAVDTQALYVSHNGGWVIASGGHNIKKYSYANVDMDTIVHLDASQSSSLRTRSGDEATNNDILSEWRDSSSKNNVYSITSIGPTLSADAINGHPGINFIPTNEEDWHTPPGDGSRHVGMQSHRAEMKPLDAVTCFVVHYDPTSKAFGDDSVRPETTGTINTAPECLVSTRGTKTRQTYDSSGFSLGYRRYNKDLDRFYAGTAGEKYTGLYDDMNSTVMTSQERTSAKILWFSGEYKCPSHKSLAWSGINGAANVLKRNVRNRPLFDRLLIGEDSRCFIGEVILCNQVMSGHELNNIGNHLSNKWGIPWFDLHVG